MNSQLIVLIGASGVGKSTVVRSLLNKYSDIFFSVSATTRSPRSGEINGKDYLFITEKKFNELIAADEFLEWAEIHGGLHKSGTLSEPVLTALDAGKSVLIEVDCAGAKSIKNKLPFAKTVFLLPPSWEQLEKRITNRGSETKEIIAKRLANAKKELALADTFDYQLVNQDVDQVVYQLVKLYTEKNIGK